MKISFGFLFLQIGTVLSNCSTYNCNRNQVNKGISCGGFFEPSCTNTRCCNTITNCQNYRCLFPDVAVPIDCTDNQCSENYCCRQTCSTYQCSHFRNDLSNPPNYCSTRRCNSNECCEPQQFCGTSGYGYTCPDGTSPKFGRIPCFGDCSFSRCCYTNTCSSSGYTPSSCGEEGRTYIGGTCGNSCTFDTCCSGPTGTGDIDGGFD